MAWLVAAAVAIFFTASGLEFISSIVLGVLAGLIYRRVERLEDRLSALERRSIPSTLPDDLDKSRYEPQSVARPAPPAAAPSGLEPTALPPEPAPAAASSNAAEDSEAAWALPSLADLERLLAGRVLALAGGLALVIGVVFFLGLAFSRGWIGPEARVIAGLLAGVAAFSSGTLLVRGRQPVVGHVLLAVGLAAANLALFAAARLYGFVPAEIALAGAFATALAATAVALRTDSQVIAAYGLVAVLAAPPVMGASPTLTTVGFLGAALVGTTILAVARDWRWLPPAGFLITAPQLAAYLVGDVPVDVGMGALIGFWLVHAVAASGEEIRRHSGEPSSSSATVLLGAAGLLVWGGFTLLDGDLEPLRGLFLVLVAVVHVVLGGVFLAREHDRHAFTLLAFGTGLAAMTMAVPIQLGGPPVPIAWAAEAAALTWIAVLRGHRYSAGAAILLGVLAVGHLVTIEYPLGDLLFERRASGLVDSLEIPFLSGRGAALAFVIGAIFVAGRLARQRFVELALASVAVALLAYAVAFEFTDSLARMTAWSAIAATTAVVLRRRLGLPLGWPVGVAPERAAVERLPYASAAFAAALALGTLLADLLPLDELADRLEAAAALGSLIDAGTAAAIVATTALLGAGYLAGAISWWRNGILAAAGVAVFALPFDLPPAWAILCWCVLGGALLLAERGDRWIGYVRGAAAVAVVAGLLILGVVMPPDRLLIDATPTGLAPVLNDQSLALICVIALSAAIWWRRPEERWTRAGAAIAAILGVYLLSIGVTDLFQAQLGREILLEELQKQAQTALSVLWAALGGIGLAVGLMRRLLAVRLFGLALLGVATAKVFLFDLATLDVAYRVLSFIGLGLLLLASAWTVFRLQTGDGSATGSEG